MPPRLALHRAAMLTLGRASEIIYEKSYSGEASTQCQVRRHVADAVLLCVQMLRRRTNSGITIANIVATPKSTISTQASHTRLDPTRSGTHRSRGLTTVTEYLVQVDPSRRGLEPATTRASQPEPATTNDPGAPGAGGGRTRASSLPTFDDDARSVGSPSGVSLEMLQQAYRPAAPSPGRRRPSPIHSPLRGARG